MTQWTDAEKAFADEMIRCEEFGERFTSAMDALVIRADAGGKAVTGLGSGLIVLDDVTLGFHPGQLVVIGARPGMGKTALSLKICDHCAADLGIPVLFVSLALRAEEVVQRLLCARSAVDNLKFRTGFGAGMRELTQLSKAYKNVCSVKKPIFT